MSIFCPLTCQLARYKTFQVENHFPLEFECSILLTSSIQDYWWQIWYQSDSHSNVSNLLFYFMCECIHICSCVCIAESFKIFFLILKFWNFARIYLGISVCLLCLILYGLHVSLIQKNCILELEFPDSTLKPPFFSHIFQLFILFFYILRNTFF